MLSWPSPAEIAERLRLWPATWSYKATNHGIVERDMLHPLAGFYAALAAMDERNGTTFETERIIPPPYFWLGAEAERA